MYLSTLIVNVGDNPDRQDWRNRNWLRNLYRVHQRLCMAFPSPERVKDDPKFLKPYSPHDFPETRHIADRKPSEVRTEALRHVHSPRNLENGFLFRVDPLPGASVAIRVLSTIAPDWDYAFQNAGYLLAEPPSRPTPLVVDLHPGNAFRFQLVANPIFRARQKSVDREGKSLDAKWIGKRVPVGNDETTLRNWLERRSERCGFRLESNLCIQTGWVYVNKTRDPSKGLRLRSVRYEGILKVTNEALFRSALATGIGPAKAFGFGLLSIAPVR